MESQEFRTQLVQRWQALRAPGELLSDDRLLARVDSLAAMVAGDPAHHNFQRWPVLGVHIWPNTQDPQTHAEAVDDIRTFLLARAAWMDAELDKLIVAIEDLPHPNSASVSLAPNPSNSANVRIQGLVQDDYPIDITWLNAQGQRFSPARSHATPALIAPTVPGFYYYRITTRDKIVYTGTWITLN